MEIRWSECPKSARSAVRGLNGKTSPRFVARHAVWSSRAADTSGSRNYVGIKNPAVDALIERVIFAKDRAGLVAADDGLGDPPQRDPADGADGQHRGGRRLAAAPQLVSEEVAKGRGGDEAIMLYTSGRRAHICRRQPEAGYRF